MYLCCCHSHLFLNGVVGWYEGVVYLTSQGCPTDIGLSWERPAILVVGKGSGGMLYFFCFFTFIPVPLSYLSLSFKGTVGCDQGVDYFTSLGHPTDFGLQLGKPAILLAGKGIGRMFLFLLFLHFPSCSSFFPVLLFHLLYYLFFFPSLWETIQNDPQGLMCR